jgi:hypothetical protein
VIKLEISSLDTQNHKQVIGIGCSCEGEMVPEPTDDSLKLTDHSSNTEAED